MKSGTTVCIPVALGSDLDAYIESRWPGCEMSRSAAARVIIREAIQAQTNEEVERRG